MVAHPFEKIDDEQKIIEYVCRDTKDVKIIQDTMNKVHAKDYACAQAALELIGNSNESVNTGLVCL